MLGKRGVWLTEAILTVFCLIGYVQDDTTARRSISNLMWMEELDVWVRVRGSRYQMSKVTSLRAAMITNCTRYC